MPYWMVLETQHPVRVPAKQQLLTEAGAAALEPSGD